MEEEWLTINVQQTLEWTQTHNFVDLINDPINDPTHVDMLWAEFYASGEDKPVKKIISILNWFKDGTPEQQTIGAAAQMSLIENAHEHRRVYHICKSQINAYDGITQKILENIVNGVQLK